jgi:hypothetical protein
MLRAPLRPQTDTLEAMLEHAAAIDDEASAEMLAELAAAAIACQRQYPPASRRAS